MWDDTRDDVQILCKYLDIPNCPNNLNNKMVACINITKQPDIIEKNKYKVCSVATVHDADQVQGQVK